MTATEAIALFRLLVSFLLQFIPIEDMREQLDAAAAERQERLKALSDDEKFGPGGD